MKKKRLRLRTPNEGRANCSSREPKAGDGWRRQEGLLRCSSGLPNIVEYRQQLRNLR